MYSYPILLYKTSSNTPLTKTQAEAQALNRWADDKAAGCRTPGFSTGYYDRENEKKRGIIPLNKADYLSGGFLLNNLWYCTVALCLQIRHFYLSKNKTCGFLSHVIHI